MEAHVRASEIAMYLSDLEEEFSPAKLELYTLEVRGMLSKSATADLETAFEKLAQAQASIRNAANRMGHVAMIQDLRL